MLPGRCIKKQRQQRKSPYRRTKASKNKLQIGALGAQSKKRARPWKRRKCDQHLAVLTDSGGREPTRCEIHTHFNWHCGCLCGTYLYFGITGAAGSPAARAKPFLRVRGRSLSAVCVKEYARREFLSRRLSGSPKVSEFLCRTNGIKIAALARLTGKCTPLFIYITSCIPRKYPSPRAPPRESQRPADRLLCI